MRRMSAVEMTMRIAIQVEHEDHEKSLLVTGLSLSPGQMVPEVGDPYSRRPLIPCRVTREMNEL